MKNKSRWIISIIFLILAPIIGVMHQIKGGGPEGSPSVDSLCPFGGLETLPTFLSSGEYIQRITPSAFILLIAVVLLTFILGKAFCGYICPLGTIQSLMNRLARKLHIKQVKIPEKLDKPLRLIKYFVLILVVFLTYKAGALIIRPYDPWAAFMHLSAGTEVFEEFLIGVIILIALLIASMFVERAFCRYLCPLGAALSITSRFRIFNIKRNSPSCISCKACTRNCPMGLDVDSSDSVSKAECISCGECISLCPVSNTLENKKGKVILSPNKAGLIAVLFLALMVGGTAVTENFETSLSNTETLNQNGVLNPENIKGYMTINDVAKEFNLPADKILEKCNLPKDTNLNVPMKDLTGELSAKGIEFDTSTLREAVEELLK